MPLTPDIAPQVVVSCRENAGQIAAALSQAFDQKVEVDAPRIEAVAYQDQLPEWNGPGLIVALQVGNEAALVLLAASSGLLPDWIESPDVAGAARLTMLADQLAKSVLPADQVVSHCQARFVAHLGEAVARGSVPAGAGGALHCPLHLGDKTEAMRLLWPATAPNAVWAEHATASVGPESLLSRNTPSLDDDAADQLQDLPSYARSLLRISVPVSVHLASIKQPVSRVLNIGPGTIIQFEKNCEQPLTLCVGSQPLAEGEAVKVGEKFGIKLTQMILPGERFFSLKGRGGRDQ
jgi:flagellar motor switch/type III secretory pathway protein FliN